MEVMQSALTQKPFATLEEMPAEVNAQWNSEPKSSSHLSGFDFVLVVVLKDAFVAQTQPPRDPLLVLKHTREELPRDGGWRWRVVRVLGLMERKGEHKWLPKACSSTVNTNVCVQRV